ncbi:hypothetical protein SAMN05192529_102131 [Arachidicoccus rhizosphaerae]|uniref:Uncharacterized protein n=1 Tax=Arachidicoccus rhizosphaerae TaxID=551991 RepID=A0A1H3W4Y0_9BACT|nr:hypothetical protein [Arachidicoccus rhizosphaerae]SDZ82060.1 hypothetical protein SAMN05192529_102131 [Arachidicoccus rhizosphaerae]
MEKLQWLFEVFKKSKAFFIVLMLGAALWLLVKFVIPAIYNGGEAAKKAQIELLTNDLVTCRNSGAMKDIKIDSLQGVINKMTSDRLKESLEREKAERERRKKYEDAMMTVNQTKKTIDNLNKKVQNEIQ